MSEYPWYLMMNETADIANTPSLEEFEEFGPEDEYADNQDLYDAWDGK